MSHDRAFFAAMNCPNPVTWSNDIKQLFTAVDVAHMKKKGIDLSSYQDVMLNAAQIYARVANGSMPPPGSGESAWPKEWVDKFGCWIQQNCPQ
jgi:hypothetical protein